MKILRSLWISAFLPLVLFVGGAFASVLGSQGHSGPAPTNNATLQFEHGIRVLLAVTAFAAIVGGLAWFGVAISATHGTLAAVLAVLAVTQLFAPKASYTLGGVTTIANLWTPQIWIQGLAERLTKKLSLINSGILATHEDVQKIAEGPGTKGEIPFLKEPDLADEIQVEDGAITVNNLASGKQTCAILNRRWAVGATALSKAVSGADPLAFALDLITDIRLRMRQVTLLSSLRGVFGFSDGPGAGTAAFKPNRRDIFSETGASPTSEKLFSSDEYIKTIGLMGENKPSLDDCVIVCHSTIETAMLLQDDITVIQDSQGKKRVQTYKGAQVFVSDLLGRAGGVSGFVYDTYIFAKGCVAYGEKPQSSEVGEVATFYKAEDTSKNNVSFNDYTRFVLHPQGAIWGGAPAGQSATNAELATVGNWTLAYGDIKNARIVCLRSNG